MWSSRRDLQRSESIVTRVADLAAVNAYIDRNLERFLAEVSEICRIPSVGADEPAMADARRWLEARFTRLGFATRSIQWEGAHPYVFATASDGARSVLFFNHYDVADYTNPVRETVGERHPFSGAIDDGNLYVDLVVRGTDRVWPSRYTLFPNPAWTLVWALASLKGTDERVLVPGFYDRVRPVSEVEERQVYAHLADDTEQLRRRAGIPAFVAGVSGRDALRRLYSEPSLAVCGIEGGADGPGQKLVLPQEARAKIEFRLVPDQDPDEILAALRTYLDHEGFGAVEVEVQGKCPPYKTEPDGWLPRLLLQTAALVYPAGAVLTPVATGIGNRYVFKRWTDMPIAGFAIGYAGYQIETNDEHIRIEDYRQQVKWVAAILGWLADR